MELKMSTMVSCGHQRFRFKDQITNVPIYLVNNKPVVFLGDIEYMLRGKVSRLMVNNIPLAFLRDDQGVLKQPLRIRADINEIIDCDLDQTNHDDMAMLMDEIRKLHDVVDKTFENSELLIKKSDALLKQTYQLAEYTVPRLFIILPDETTKFNPTNLLQHSYRLYFLCEYGEHPHFALHEGYKIHQPREFIKKYGSYLKHMITIVKISAAVAGSIAIPAIGFVDSIVVDCLVENLEKVNNALDEMKNEENLKFSANAYLEGADLRRVESFLKRKDQNQRLGDLYRTTTDTGDIRWVCIHHHHNRLYSDKKLKELQKRFRSLNGIIREDELIIDKNGEENFDEMLSIISEGLYRFKMTLLKCQIKKSDFENMLNIIGRHHGIKYLELIFINVSYCGLGLVFMQHIDIIDKLKKVIEKQPNLTIKYVVKYPQDKFAFDLNLFDYAVQHSTERLLLHIYTKYDGKKIVFQDLDRPILYRMMKSLNQSSTITHCAIKEFNRELSDILLVNTKITHLTIFLVVFDEQKTAALRQLLTKRIDFTELRCSGCKNLSSLITMLSEEMTRNIQLKVLAINDISECQHFIQLVTMLKKNNHLIELNLALDSFINIQAMIKLSEALKINQCLKQFKLTGIRGEIHENSFRNTSLEKLVLHFRDRQTPMNLYETIEATENVQFLELSRCKLNSNITVPMNISNSLTSLCLHSCQLSFDIASDLFQSLTGNKTLTTLILNEIYFQNDKHKQLFFKALANMLRDNIGLKKLIYSHGNLGDEGLGMIAEALKSNQTLQELNINFNQITTIGADLLATALTNNGTLLLLNIQNNNILFDGIYNILKSLQSNRILRHLYIPEMSYKNNLYQFHEAKEELFNVNQIINIY